MASLTGSTIAASYEQLLSLPDGGLNGNTLVAVTDGDSSTAIGMKVATSKIEVIPASDDANAFEVSQADGTAVLTVNTSTVGATLIGALTVGADDAGHDVIFYGDTASSNMTWDTSGDDLILNDSRLFIDQDDNDYALYIEAQNTTSNAFEVISDALTTGKAAQFYSNSSDTNTRSLVRIYNDNTSATGTTALNIRQDANQKAIVIDSAATTNHVLRIDGPLTTTGVCFLIDDVDAITTGNIAKFHSNSSDTGTRELVRIHNDHASATNAIPLSIVQDAASQAMKIEQNAVGAGLFIDQNTNHNAISIDAENTTDHSVYIESNVLTTGTSLKAYSNSSDNSTRNLVEITNDHASADNTVGLLIQQDGADASIELTGNGSIKFPGTQGASSDANSLDDYEEGYYTATLTCGSGTVTLNSSYDQLVYTKIGRMVYVQGGIVISAVSSNSGTLILNLPFTLTDITESADNTCGVASYYGMNALKSAAPIIIRGSAGAATAHLRELTTTSEDGSDMAENITTSSQLYINFSFLV